MWEARFALVSEKIQSPPTYQQEKFDRGKNAEDPTKGMAVWQNLMTKGYHWGRTVTAEGIPQTRLDHLVHCFKGIGKTRKETEILGR